MADEMNKEIQGALEQVYEKHLPKSQAEWLKGRLELVNQLEEKLEDKEETIETLQETNRELSKEISELKRNESKVETQRKINDDRTKELQKRDKEVTERENKAEVTELKTKLEAAEKIANAHQGFLGTLTKAPLVRKTIHKDVSKMHDSNHYNNQTGQYETVESGSSEHIDESDEVIE